MGMILTDCEFRATDSSSSSTGQNYCMQDVAPPAQVAQKGPDARRAK
jgi:hypothetical protein